MKSHRSGYTAIPGSDALPASSVQGLRRRVVHRDAVAVPVDVFDRLALHQEPEELAVYMHLWRLAAADEKDGCRVSRAELERRVRISQLRLGKALAGLVEKGHIVLLDRNRTGTLYRVRTPEEALDGRAAPRPSTTMLPIPAAAAAPMLSIGELARWFIDTAGAGRGRSPDEVIEEILGLVELGHSLDVIRTALARFIAEAPKRTPIAELPRYVGP